MSGVKALNRLSESGPFHRGALAKNDVARECRPERTNRRGGSTPRTVKARLTGRTFELPCWRFHIPT